MTVIRANTALDQDKWTESNCVCPYMSCNVVMPAALAPALKVMMSSARTYRPTCPSCALKCENSPSELKEEVIVGMCGLERKNQTMKEKRSVPGNDSTTRRHRSMHSRLVSSRPALDRGGDAVTARCAVTLPIFPAGTCDAQQETMCALILVSPCAAH